MLLRPSHRNVFAIVLEAPGEEGSLSVLYAGERSPGRYWFGHGKTSSSVCIAGVASLKSCSKVHGRHDIDLIFVELYFLSVMTQPFDSG